MDTTPTLENPRRVRARDGTWTFFARASFSIESASRIPSLLFSTPNGRVFDLYLPLGVEPGDLSDKDLVGRARARLQDHRREVWDSRPMEAPEDRRRRGRSVETPRTANDVRDGGSRA